MPRQRGDGDAAAVVRESRRTPAVRKARHPLFFLVKMGEERVPTRRFNERARVCVCGRVGNRRERVETVKRIKEAKKNDGCRQCRRRRRRVARGGGWRRRAKKKTDISETNDAFRASAGRSTRRSRGKTRSRARVGRTRVHSDGAVRVRDGDQVHAAERLIGAGPVQRPSVCVGAPGDEIFEEK